MKKTSKASNKAALLFFSVALLLAGGAATVRAQSALDGFDPNANGTVRAVVVQPDGKILIGGDFTTLAPNGGGAVPRNRIARLNSDGTLDLAFDPNANGVVNTIALEADGGILVGGVFSDLGNGTPTIGGKIRNRIARLDPITGALQDPVLELHDSNGNTLAVNDNWKEAQQAEIEATGIPPRDDHESAIVTTLAPSNAGYTAIVRGANDTTGVALVEVYALD
jgi:Domain of unknown function (DUF5122) beta-propeller